MKSKKLNFTYSLRVLHPEVTGSCIILNIHFPSNVEKNILIDFGMFQEVEYEEENYTADINVHNIDAVFVTHPHIDHIGRLPYLVKLGYNGPIYCTALTKQISNLLLNNSVTILYSNYEKEKKVLKNVDPPLYSFEDVEKTISLMKVLNLNEEVEFTDDVFVTFLDNGHLLSASSIFIEARYKQRKSINILFSGDYKKNNAFKDVSPIPKHILEKENLNIVVESTLFENYEEPKKTFRESIISEIEKNQNILILSLCQERLETILYELKCIEEMGYDLEIWIDTPLGISLLNIYLRASHLDFMPKDVHFVSIQPEREILYRSPKRKIVITSSGMADAGNAPYYLKYFLPISTNSIFFTSYLAQNSVGRKVVETQLGSKICLAAHWEGVVKNASVFQTREFSSHGSPNELIELIEQFKNISNVFVNHGSALSKELFKSKLMDMGLNACKLEPSAIYKIDCSSKLYIIEQEKKEEKNIVKRPSKFSNLNGRTIPLHIRKQRLSVATIFEANRK